MSLDLKQSLKLTQQLLMTPQLQQAIKLLQLSRLDLEEFVASQIIENPVLEDQVRSNANDEELYANEVRQTELKKDQTNDEDANKDYSNYNVDIVGSSRQRMSKNNFEEERFNYENVITKPETLQEHLIQQVGEISFSDKEKEIAYKIVGNLTEDGYLDLDLEKFCIDESVELEDVEGVLDTIQRLDPNGIGARNLEECLEIQLRNEGLKNGVVEKIVSGHLKDLETRNYISISKKLNISLEDVYSNVAIIVGLNPTPGRQFSELTPQVVIPDVYAFKIAEKWVVSLNEDNLPRLKINSFYREKYNETNPGSEKAYLQEKIKSANWLIKSIEQRQRTIKRVAECIIEKQVDFLENGIKSLKPMVLRDVAEALELHESTISRVTSNKYMQTPRGVFELKFFFTSSIKSDEEDVSSSFVKSIIKEIVGSENQLKPFSDQKIVALLSEKGVHLARRTVAKYREQLGILPSSKRKKFF